MTVRPFHLTGSMTASTGLSDLLLSVKVLTFYIITYSRNSYLFLFAFADEATSLVLGGAEAEFPFALAEQAVLAVAFANNDRHL